jgi:hypothetical protein
MIGVTTMKLSHYYAEYERIASKEPGRERDKELSRLMDEMKREFKIPLLRDPEWEAKHKAVISLYRIISESRTTI